MFRVSESFAACYGVVKKLFYRVKIFFPMKNQNLNCFLSRANIYSKMSKEVVSIKHDYINNIVSRRALCCATLIRFS